MTSMPTTTEMERAFQARDVSYDGVFYLAVRTTGIFCRPSCPARKPLVSNVEYYATAREALFAGYRPCLRCRPLAAGGEPPEWIASLLQDIETDPAGRVRDQDLRARGLEPARVRRYFRDRFGMTFHAYCRGRRLGAAFMHIKTGAQLDDVILGHGYESHSGFRDAFVRTFGDAPGRSRSADCITLAWTESPLGPLLLGATTTGLCLLEFTDRRMLETQFTTLKRRFACAIVPGTNAHVERAQSELREYFDGARRVFTGPLVAPGTPFQERVWAELQRIPYGETRSYEDLARSIGRPTAFRAVARANGTNRIGIVIPCHRVVNKSGELGGYGGGLWRKRKLLELERGAR